jgi:antagonist of KipI
VIEVVTPGLLTTVQDLGREGFAPIGVSQSGAADALAFRLGNLLLGNDENAPALEMTLTGGAFRFPQGGAVALAGSDFSAMLDGNAVAPWTAMEIEAGKTLQVGVTVSGARCYLCVHGGIAVKPFLGSASTHVLTQLGGFEGRGLRAGDVLAVNGQPSKFKERTLCADVIRRLEVRKVLRVTEGPQSGGFDEGTKHIFYGARYTVAEASNRMGIRLAGPGVHSTGGEMISEGVSLGAIQVPPSGEPIIVFVEQQTTGGYPIIANVISADFHSLGQLRPRDEIGFESVDFETARALLIDQEQMLTSQDIFCR